MNDQNKMRIIKAAYWAGIIADALWTIALVHAPFFEMLTGRSGIEGDLNLRLVMGIGASLMAGWTALLFWASRKPIERRGVLMLTFCPVIVGLFIVTVVGMINGDASSMWILAKLIILAAAMVGAYVTAGRMENEYRTSNREQGMEKDGTRGELPKTPKKRKR